jgi:hypothetical protein
LFNLSQNIRHQTFFTLSDPSKLRQLALFGVGIFCKSLSDPFPPMLAKIYSAAVYDVDAYEVEIEVNIGPGKPVMVIVGLPDVAVKESRDRVWTAIANSGYRPSRKRTTINLAPADIKKEGPSFDLPIAVRNSTLVRSKNSVLLANWRSMAVFVRSKASSRLH